MKKIVNYSELLNTSINNEGYIRSDNIILAEANSIFFILNLFEASAVNPATIFDADGNDIMHIDNNDIKFPIRIDRGFTITSPAGPVSLHYCRILTGT